MAVDYSLRMLEGIATRYCDHIEELEAENEPRWVPVSEAVAPPAVPAGGMYLPVLLEGHIMFLEFLPSGRPIEWSLAVTHWLKGMPALPKMHEEASDVD